jgi:hypothetical protein
LTFPIIGNRKNILRNILRGNSIILLLLQGKVPEANLNNWIEFEKHNKADKSAKQGYEK